MQWQYYFQREMLGSSAMPSRSITPPAITQFTTIRAKCLPRANGSSAAEWTSGSTRVVLLRPAWRPVNDLRQHLWTGSGGEGTLETEWLEQTLIQQSDARHKLSWAIIPYGR